jgi:hypothetical protein
MGKWVGLVLYGRKQESCVQWMKIQGRDLAIFKEVTQWVKI